MRKIKKCQIENCQIPHLAKGYCHRHYFQMRNQGRIKNRIIKEKNEIIFGRFFCIMKLYNIEGEEVGETYFDFEDYEKVKDIVWWKDYKGYTISYNKGMDMARYLLEIPANKFPDHKNRKPWDNRRKNIRESTYSENNRNRKVPSNNTSGHKGVGLNKRTNKWTACLWKNKKHIHLGYFNSKEEAIKARIIGEKEQYGKFSTTKF
jgi:hypothetical protein